MQFPIASHLEYSALNPEEIVPRLRNLAADAFVIWGGQDSAIALLEAMRNAGIRAPVLGPSNLATPELARRAPKSGEVIAASPFDFSREAIDLQTFKRKFEARSGVPATWVAIYCYDTARLVIQSIGKAGLNRARIRDAMSSASFQGLAGKIGFNQLGANDSPPVLMSLEAGGWVPIH